MKEILLFSCIFLLSACGATSEDLNSEINPVNLVNDKDSLEKLWLVSKPNYPKYPGEAIKRGISGCVDFAFTIGQNGRAQDIRVIKAIPDTIFIRAAMASLKKFKWEPTSSNRIRQPAMTTLQLDFSTSPVMKVADCIVDET